MELTPSDYIAGYAAIVATAAVFLQWRSSLRAKRPEVRLLLDAWSSQSVGNLLLLDDVTIRIVNREDYTIRVDKVYFLVPSPLQLLVLLKIQAEIKAGNDPVSLPLPVPEHDQVSLTLRPSRPYRLKIGPQSFVPRVGLELRTGERYTSRRTSEGPKHPNDGEAAK